MRNTKHTCGPWSLSVTGTIFDSPAEWDVIDGNGVIANVVSVNEADARLIAASPELLAMLIKLVQAIDRMPSNPADGIADQAKELIAKTIENSSFCTRGF